MNKQKTVSDNGKKPNKAKVSKNLSDKRGKSSNLGKKNASPEIMQHEAETKVSAKIKPITVVVCANGNTICCRIDEEKQTVGILSGKIKKGETSSSVAHKIGSTKTGSGLTDVKFGYSEIFEDLRSQNTLEVKVYFATTPVSDFIKPNEIWIPISHIVKKDTYRKYEIRPLTRHIVSELLASGKLQKTA